MMSQVRKEMSILIYLARTRGRTTDLFITNEMLYH